MELITVDVSLCVRCGACAIVAPRVFQLTAKGTRVIAQPESDRERAACRAAALVCPTAAIGAT